MNTLSSRIKYLRKTNNLTQEELGARLGVGKTTISNWEKEYSSPDNDFLVKLANILGCTTDYLLCRTDNINVVILEGEKLPKELRGIIDAIGIAKDAGLTEEDIQEILQLQAKIRKKS